MKKIILGIFTILSSITFASSNISGPKVYLGGGIGLGTQYLLDRLDLGVVSVGLDLDANIGPIWTHKIDERNSIDFGPIFSLTLKNHYASIQGKSTYMGQLVGKANMFFDYNIKSNENTTIYLGAKLGGGVFFYWFEEVRDFRADLDIDMHAGVKLNNDTLRIGGAFGKKGLIFEVGKIF